MADEDEKKEEIIIVKKIVKGGGHHGGAWKVAYADFVTAMMAFFLLLWLLNVVTGEEKQAISNYFEPTPKRISQQESGSGGVLGGLSMQPQGAQADEAQVLPQTRPTGYSGMKEDDPKRQVLEQQLTEEEILEKAKEALRKLEQEKFDAAKKKIMEAIENTPELADLAKNLIIDMTPEGLRIQLVDSEGRPMFASGSANMLPHTRALMAQVAGVIKDLPNQLSVRGHTDSVPYGANADYTNWELSTDRANMSRRVLEDEGEISATRLHDVVGKADTDHLFPEDPLDPRNRRISIILLKEEITNPEFQDKAAELASDEEFREEVQEEAAKEIEPSSPARPVPSSDLGIPIGTFRKPPEDVQF